MSGVLIVGAGQAGGTAALQLRASGYDGDIKLAGSEPHAPYERPPLSKGYLSGALAYNSLLVRPETTYEQQQIELLKETTIATIDPESGIAQTSKDCEIKFDRLLFTTGARPRQLLIPGAELPGVYYLRTIADVEKLKGAMATAKRVCLIGGGYVGLEFASVAIKAGLDVTVLESADRLLKRVTTETMSHYFENLHRSQGVDIQCNSEIFSIEGEVCAERVVCRNSVIEADLILVGIGAIPNTELAESAGVECDNGILVDEQCRTSVANIYAAGDCTNHPNHYLNRRLRLESAPNATDQAKVAAVNMLGEDKCYRSVPWFWSDQFSSKLQAVGFSADGTSSVCRGRQEEHEFATFYLHDNRLVAGEAINFPRAFMVGKRLYGLQVDVEKLADSSVDLKSLLV